MSSSELVLGVVMLAIAGGYYLLGTLITQSALDDAVGPRGLPRTYAIVLGALALVTIARALAARSRHAQSSGGRHGRSAVRPSWRAAGMVVIGIGYIAAAPWLGYLPSIALLIAGTAWYQGGTIDRRVALVAAAGAVFMWLLFVAFLGIPQPSGVWDSIF